jgi:hypothetical protein
MSLSFPFSDLLTVFVFFMGFFYSFLAFALVFAAIFIALETVRFLAS